MVSGIVCQNYWPWSSLYGCANIKAIVTCQHCKRLMKYASSFLAVDGCPQVHQIFMWHWKFWMSYCQMLTKWRKIGNEALLKLSIIKHVLGHQTWTIVLKNTTLLCNSVKLSHPRSSPLICTFSNASNKFWAKLVKLENVQFPGQPAKQKHESTAVRKEDLMVLKGNWKR